MHRGRGNLLLGSEVLYHPINIEHFGYLVLIGAWKNRYFLAGDCTTGIPFGHHVGLWPPRNDSGGRWPPAPNEQLLIQS